MLSEKKSSQNSSRFGHARGPAKESDILTGDFWVSVTYHKKHEYIWLRGLNLNGFIDILDFKGWLDFFMPPVQPLIQEFQISNFLAKLYINIYHIRKKKIFRTITSVVCEK